MREFFKTELTNLKAKTGLNQLENFTAMKDPSGKPIGNEQIKLLLDELTKATLAFPEIPDTHKQRIIQESMLTDQDFTGLYAKWVYKVLNQVRGRYFKESAHQDKENVYERIELTEEQRIEVDKILDEFKASLVGGFNSVLTSEEIKREGRDRDDSLKGELDKLAPAPSYRSFVVKGIQVQALSQEHAERLLQNAIDRGEIEEVQE